MIIIVRAIVMIIVTVVSRGQGRDLHQHDHGVEEVPDRVGTTEVAPMTV